MEVRGRGNFYSDASRAQKYSEMEHLRSDGEARAAQIHVEPSWTIIDIGPGPGTLTVPLARRSTAVTAVEASPYMAQHLLARAEEEGLTNITVHISLWEDAEGLEPHDMVVASYCLTMPDIEYAVRKMNSLAREQVHIYWFAGVTYWEQVRVDLYPKIHGREHVPGPKVDVLFNVLYSLGIYPDVELLSRGGLYERKTSLEEAIRDLRETLELEDGTHGEILEQYVKETYEFRDGEYVRPDPTVKMRVSWKPIPL